MTLTSANPAHPPCHTLHADRITEFEQGHARGIALGRLLQKIEQGIHRFADGTIDIHDLGTVNTTCDHHAWNLTIQERDGDMVTIHAFQRMA